MEIPKDSKLKSACTLLGVLGLLVIVGIFPHAFAITYTDADNPAGPLQMMGWAAGFAVAGVLSGVGIWTSVRSR